MSLCNLILGVRFSERVLARFPHRQFSPSLSSPILSPKCVFRLAGHWARLVLLQHKCFLFILLLLKLKLTSIFFINGVKYVSDKERENNRIVEKFTNVNLNIII